MILLIDMDQTICDLITPFLKIYNRECNDNLTINDITEYNLANFVKSEYKHKVVEIFTTPGFFLNLEPLPYSIEVLNRLKRSHSIWIVTKPMKGKSVDEKVEWVRHYLPFLESNLIFTDKKYMIRGDMLFDDCPEYIADFHSNTVVMDYPYNRNVRADFRVNNWLEFEQIVKIQNYSIS